MPSPRCRLGGSLRKSGADSNGISGTFCTLARALSWAGVRVSAGVWAGAWANSGIAQANAAHNGKVLASIWLLHDTPKAAADGWPAAPLRLLRTGGGFLLKFSGHSDDRRDVGYGRAIGNVLYRELLAPPEHSGGITVSLARSGHA